MYTVYVCTVFLAMWFWPTLFNWARYLHCLAGLVSDYRHSRLLSLLHRPSVISLMWLLSHVLKQGFCCLRPHLTASPTTFHSSLCISLQFYLHHCMPTLQVPPFTCKWPQNRCVSTCMLYVCVCVCVCSWLCVLCMCICVCVHACVCLCVSIYFALEQIWPKVQPTPSQAYTR
jgi:hypothetical protein